MQYPLCRHIKTSGVRCQSPSLSEASLCYFHSRLYRRHTGFRQLAPIAGQPRATLIPGQHIELAPLEDRESVQVALSVVINALATGQLDTRRATALLYGLQLASINSAHLHLSPYAPDMVRSVQSTPEGLDLAEPGATLEINDGSRSRRREHHNPGKADAGKTDAGKTDAGKTQETGAIEAANESESSHTDPFQFGAA